MSVGDATVQFGRLRLTLMLEKDLTAEWTAIGIAFVAEKRNDNHVRLDSSYMHQHQLAEASRKVVVIVNRQHAFGGALRGPGGKLRGKRQPAAPERFRVQ